MYSNPRGWRGTRRGASCVTDQIPDHFAPHCYELGNTAINKIRVGVLFGYYIVTPLSINFLGNYTISSEVFNDFDLSSYIGLLRASVLASGLIFELPIIIHYLTKVGLVTPDFLRRNRKFALVIVLSLSAIITPPDIASQIIVSIPILILYEISIIISKIGYKKLNT